MLYPPEYNIVLFCKKRNGLTVDTGYTTEEQFTGEYWIDGKPVYKKVINGTLTVPQEGSVQLKPWSNFSNIATLIKLEGTLRLSI